MNSISSSSAGLKLKQLEQADQQVLMSDANCLVELRLGISSSDGGGSSPSWRVDPWSLAARQDNKVPLEKQAHQHMPDAWGLRQSRGATVAPPDLPVGWPPVRAFRKNLSSSGSKPAAWAKPVSEEDVHGAASGGELPPQMLVKVNLEGCAVGRKVDLRAHRGYGSLSRALQAMFRGFLHLSAGHGGQWRIAAGNTPTKDEEDEAEEQQPSPGTKGPSDKTTYYVLLYEDSEGDRMLVGDVPWELFVSSVKRLYIVQDIRTRATR